MSGHCWHYIDRLKNSNTTIERCCWCNTSRKIITIAAAHDSRTHGPHAPNNSHAASETRYEGGDNDCPGVL